MGDDIYNTEEIHDRLEEIAWDGATFADAHVIDGEAAEGVADIEDDLQRELSFYNQVSGIIQPHLSISHCAKCLLRILTPMSSCKDITDMEAGNESKGMSSEALAREDMWC